jgi:hypothetical protein
MACSSVRVAYPLFRLAHRRVSPSPRPEMITSIPHQTRPRFGIAALNAPLLVGALFFTAWELAAAPFLNGGFENPVLPNGSEIGVGPGNDALLGWSVGGTGRGINIVRGLIVTPKEGSQFVLFNGGNSLPGNWIAQTFDTIAGRRYRVSFAVARTGPGTASGNVSIVASVKSQAGETLEQSVAIPVGNGFGPTQEFVFTAVSGASTIQFADTSSATVSVDLLLDAVSIVQFPVIITQPAGSDALLGGTAFLSVTADGPGPLTYQWRRDGVPISGATASTLALSNVQAVNAGLYSVVVGNGAGVVTSSDARLNVLVPSTPPSIVAQPASQTVNAGLGVTFAASVDRATSFQWFRNGVAIPGATGSSLSLSRLQESDAGSYTLLASNGFGSVSSSPAVLTVRLPFISNLSVRSSAGDGDRTLIVGLVIAGQGKKQTLLRGVGPSLGQFGVNGALLNPQLRFFREGALFGQNDDWGGDSALAVAFSRVGAFSLPTTSRDSALLVELASGAYTAQVVSDGSPGVVLLEAYDADATVTGTRFVNLSARNFVGTGDNILIVGFVISGNAPKTVLIRAAGPSLAQFGVGNVIADPRLQVFRGASVLESNDDWGGGSGLSAAFVQAGAFSFPVGSRDAALLLQLQPGSYTAQVSGVNNSTGVGLVELYEIP